MSLSSWLKLLKITQIIITSTTKRRLITQFRTLLKFQWTASWTSLWIVGPCSKVTRRRLSTKRPNWGVERSMTSLLSRTRIRARTKGTCKSLSSSTSPFHTPLRVSQCKKYSISSNKSNNSLWFSNCSSRCQLTIHFQGPTFLLRTRPWELTPLRFPIPTWLTKISWTLFWLWPRRKGLRRSPNSSLKIRKWGTNSWVRLVKSRNRSSRLSRLPEWRN